ncbi:MAG TPA: cyclopropane fatty acyl phospholipid synthase [Nanoarchaeota archaeon]|nr:MAG: cyclopropane-fatty-acyl-phospholipid synthase [archaeon GW2011_AR18]HIH25734.1 cyclopropane fatty acyl phospholipid synthase [Nanoarchaeota archaeon]
MPDLKEKAEEILALADIKINGSRPWDIKVNSDEFYNMVFAHGSLGFGESYMDGLWDCKKLDELINKIFLAKLNKKVVPFSLIFPGLKAKLLNMQTKSKSKIVAEQHYDLGNDFYSAMLGNSMQYTCAYWKNAKTLDQAQFNKLDLVCKKLNLKKGDKVLELGCGWGYLAKFMAENYGCEVTAYNISEEQVKFAKGLCKGLKVNIVKADYREAEGVFDKVVSIGLCEHIGYKNYRVFMELADRCLKPHGLFLLHTIGGSRSVTHTDPWIEKYIFPNSMLPSVKQLSSAMEDLFVMEDWHNFGAYYDRTLLAWNDNFEKNWPKFKDQYGEKFYRMWKFYLLSCAASFRCRKNQLWQIVLSKDGISNGYTSVR